MLLYRSTIHSHSHHSLLRQHQHTQNGRIAKVCSILLFLTSPVTAFSTVSYNLGHYAGSSIPYTNTRLYQANDEMDEDYDDTQRYVQLAEESAILITGVVNHKPGKADAVAEDLKRYKQLRTVEANVIQELLSTKSGHSILCTGQGVELYKDPGTTTIKEVYYAPKEAIKDALLSAGSAIHFDRLRYNFLGGDDLILGEVLEACNTLTLDLDIATKTKISFSSLCHSDIPSGTCTVAVVALGKEKDDDDNEKDDERLVSGEVFLRDGVYYVLQSSDINDGAA